MATHRRREVLVPVLFLVGVLVDFVRAGRTLSSSDKSTDVKFTEPPKGTVKTIQNGRGGDIVDCVDIYRQPAFDHPSLKNHTIQMKPSWFLEEEDGDHHRWLQRQAVLEGWGVDCPEGTIPIIRKTSRDGPDVKDRSYINRFSSNHSIKVVTEAHEYAQVSLTGAEGTYHGARGSFNLWKPFTELGEISVSQMWINAGPPDTVNTIEAGWIVGHDFDMRNTRLFIYWTSDNYRSTGCYNLKCPGFVQTSTAFSPGAILQPSSQYGGEQKEIPIEIKQDKRTGDWWLEVMHLILGYWPASLFSNLGGGAHTIAWGGEVVNYGRGGRHTTTQMGSGHFPRDGYFTKSAFIKDIGHVQETWRMRRTPVESLHPLVTKAQCYDLVKGPPDRSFGTHVYFGGVGFSDQCPV